MNEGDVLCGHIRWRMLPFQAEGMAKCKDLEAGVWTEHNWLENGEW